MFDARPLAGTRQVIRREIAQNDFHRQQRAMRPRLRFFSGIAFIIGQRRGQARQIGAIALQAFPGQADDEEIDERAFAASGLAKQRKAQMLVQQVNGGAHPLAALQS